MLFSHLSVFAMALRAQQSLAGAEDECSFMQFNAPAVARPSSERGSTGEILLSVASAVLDAESGFVRGNGLVFTGEWVGSLGGCVLCSLLIFSFLALAIQIIRDFVVFRRLSRAKGQRCLRCEGVGRKLHVFECPDCKGTGMNPFFVDAAAPEPTEKEEWSLPGLIALTAYRFYTGYLSATWLPYLLAMEGQDLWKENQSLFMGVAKLIYGLTILLNPIFGLFGDQVVKFSHGAGRRLFVCSGVCVACVGILTCLLAAKFHHFSSFIVGILIWRLGEALNDVTTEALVPEMVPQSQFKIASAIKASSFLFGGLFGYVLLILFVEVHYSWLYYSYLLGMFLCAVPSLLLLNNEGPFGNPREHKDGFVSSMVQAYILPTKYEGGFPRACLAVFVFSLGTSPMFFLLLILRDVVGEVNPVKLQQHFSVVSIIFFVSAAVSSVVGAMIDDKPPPPGTPEADKKIAEIRKRKVEVLVASMCVFAGVVVLIPALALFKEPANAQRAFYALAVVFGGSFGTAFSRFQDCTWAELPAGGDIANAMGFNVMTRLLGVGLGNFGAGIVLDCFYTGASVATMPHARWHHASPLSLLQAFQPHVTDMPQVYKPMGYFVMCELCAALVLLAAYIAWDALKLPVKGAVAKSEAEADATVPEPTISS